MFMKEKSKHVRTGAAQRESCAYAPYWTHNPITGKGVVLTINMEGSGNP